MSFAFPCLSTPMALPFYIMSPSHHCPSPHYCCNPQCQCLPVPPVYRPAAAPVGLELSVDTMSIRMTMLHCCLCQGEMPSLFTVFISDTFSSLTCLYGFVQTANPNLFFGISRLILESLDSEKTMMKCNFCKSDASHIWRWFEMRFPSNFYRRVSVRTPWPAQIGYYVIYSKCLCHLQRDTRQRQIHSDGNASE